MNQVIQSAVGEGFPGRARLLPSLGYADRRVMPRGSAGASLYRARYHRAGPPGQCLTGAFSILECLVYIAVLMVIMALLAAVYYRADWNHRNLTRNAADIVRALQAGERWREDVRLASGPIRLGQGTEGPELSIPHTNGLVKYAFREGAVWRQTGPAARWQEALAGVRSSRMEKGDRRLVAAWRWEVELKSRQPVARLRPLFAFEAVTRETKP